MGAAPKPSKRVDIESQHTAENENDSESGMQFVSKRKRKDFADEDDSASEGESLQDSEMQEDEDEIEGSDVEQNGRKIDAEMDELEQQYKNLRSEEQ
ncbi:hypothetical protein BHE74_00043935 [Ensete ventricosum]|uniref:Uncharacterized protein n=1 Tax=Ensete ventricosum TaxID=4639 RepID=A0A444CPU6_ENSVE|nr:hypothetical protein B296_00028515 [Ensete ventricosum]RWV87904.1 hypothetical protein GW17_00050058 [Ensete ventricosum]RWW49847.1 hypothetical protein BHE74_00043935 [Ensete ventricosum]RZS01491.1 hypothetical protein BHM03_00031358 [Ensete ventricosum]